jgi:hypothetical protein
MDLVADRLGFQEVGLLHQAGELVCEFAGISPRRKAAEETGGRRAKGSAIGMNLK